MLSFLEEASGPLSSYQLRHEIFTHGFGVSGSLAAHGSDARTEASKNGATAHNGHNDPGDHVVGLHESSRLSLLEK